MNHLKDLPAPVVDLIRRSFQSEFGTVSSAGVPIDTPMNHFWSEDLKSLDCGTGLGYPIKAERVRRNPKVGLLLEGCGPDEPVISIAGLGAVRDSDLQANTERYIAETAGERVNKAPWSLAKNAVWYYCKIIIEIVPVRILWWASHTEMESPPHRWDAPADTVYPPSDPAPPGELSTAAKWPQPSWRELARRAMAREAMLRPHRMPGVLTPDGIRATARAPAHLTVCDDQGYPLPIRVRDVQLVDDGFRMSVPKGAPWQRSGKATLTYEGLETFIGDITPDGDMTFLKVERALPLHPITADPKRIWEPTQETYDGLMTRVKQELARRNQPIPTISAAEPVPTEGARLRMARIASFGTPDPVGR